MDCDLEKVQALSYTLPLAKLVAFLDEAAKSDAVASAMLKHLGTPVLEVDATAPFSLALSLSLFVEQALGAMFLCKKVKGASDAP